MYGLAAPGRVRAVAAAGGGLVFGDRGHSMSDVAPGMDVCDVSGEKVGTVARIHRPVAAPEVVEVKTGPFGFGKHLFVPAGEVDGVTEAGLILKHPKHEFHEIGLDAKPDDF